MFPDEGDNIIMGRMVRGIAHKFEEYRGDTKSAGSLDYRSTFHIDEIGEHRDRLALGGTDNWSVLRGEDRVIEPLQDERNMHVGLIRTQEWPVRLDHPRDMSALAQTERPSYGAGGAGVQDPMRPVLGTTVRRGNGCIGLTDAGKCEEDTAAPIDDHGSFLYLLEPEADEKRLGLQGRGHDYSDQRIPRHRAISSRAATALLPSAPRERLKSFT